MKKIGNEILVYFLTAIYVAVIAYEQITTWRHKR